MTGRIPCSCVVVCERLEKCDAWCLINYNFYINSIFMPSRVAAEYHIHSGVVRRRRQGRGVGDGGGGARQRGRRRGCAPERTAAGH